MKQYKDVISDILLNGADSEDRTGVGTRSVFGVHMTFDIRETFPLLTLKRTFWKGVVAELMWMLSGSTNAFDLPENVQQWWTPWADQDGSLGPTYGKQFRNSGGVDQLRRVVDGIKNNPNSRRHNIALWNPGEVDQMNLPPCHGNLIQFYVRNGELSCQMYQRSGDMFLGVPVNIAFYSLLTYMIAEECGLRPGFFNHCIGDAHIYNNHIEQCEKMVLRDEPELPTLEINYPDSSGLFEFVDVDYRNMTWKEVLKVISLKGYKPNSGIKGDVAI
jgi:thymidylate synthase